MQEVYQKELTNRLYFPISTYQSLKELLKQTDRDKGVIHVFGTGKQAKNVQLSANLPTIDIEEIFQTLFPDFRKASIGIYLQSKAREKILNSRYENQTYLLNRLESIVNTYYLFAELGVHTVDYPFQTKRKSEVADIINHLLTDPVTKEYHQKRVDYSRAEIGMKIAKDPVVDRLIIYEIEYMNFGRMSLIHWLKQKGFSVEFRVPYHKHFPYIHEYWEEVYKVITRLSISELASEPLLHLPSGQRFGFFYENLSLPLKDRADVTFYEFDTPHDFAKYYQQHDDIFVAANPDEVRTVIENSKAPLYENDIGKFIYFLQFCKVEKDTLLLSFATLTELITSSLIHLKNVEGQRALSLLIDLQEYMSGVESIDEIKERLNRLVELEHVSLSFDRENGEDAGRNRMKRYMLNPFRSFSFLNQDRYKVTINQLIELVDQTEKVCRYLILEENKAMNVNEYFDRWRFTLDKLLEEHPDKALWIGYFNENYPVDWEFSINELLQLLYLKISSYNKTKQTIHSIDAVQELIMSSDHSRPLHVTNMSQLNFPERHRSVISDFFSYTELKECIQSMAIESSSYLHSLWVDYSVASHIEKLGSYQLYTLLTHYRGPVHFSWIRHLQRDDFRNIFLDILADLYCDGKIHAYSGNQLPVFEQPKSLDNISEEKIKLETIKGKIPNLFWLDHDFCSKKFFLTALIEQQQVYESDFHHELLFSKIGKLFSLSKTEKADFQNLIYPLFPQWTDTKKENLIDTEYKTEFRQYKTFENISYPKQMKGLHLLRSVYRENRRTKARNQYRRDKTFEDKNLLEQFLENIKPYSVKAEPGNHCKMCPHLESCLEGMYAIEHISH